MPKEAKGLYRSLQTNSRIKMQRKKLSIELHKFWVTCTEECNGSKSTICLSEKRTKEQEHTHSDVKENAFVSWSCSWRPTVNLQMHGPLWKIDVMDGDVCTAAFWLLNEEQYNQTSVTLFLWCFGFWLTIFY